MDPKLLAILGTAVSAVIAALSYWAKTRHDRRRATRVVLYYLLEVHHLAQRIQFGLKDFPTRYISYCREALAKRGMTMSDSDAAAVSLGLQQIVRQFTTSESSVLSAALAEPFEKALAELSREDPVLAFKLRGRDQLMLLSRKLDAVIPSVPPADGARPEQSLSVAHPQVDDVLRELTVAELESAIRATAWRCDLVTHLQVILLLRKATRAIPGIGRRPRQERGRQTGRPACHGAGTRVTN